MDKKYEEEFQRERKYFKSPNIKSLVYLARNARTPKPVTPQEHYQRAVEFHNNLHLGEFDSCGSSFCTAARQLKVKASDYYINIEEK